MLAHEPHAAKLAHSGNTNGPSERAEAGNTRAHAEPRRMQSETCWVAYHAARLEALLPVHARLRPELAHSGNTHGVSALRHAALVRTQNHGAKARIATNERDCTIRDCDGRLHLT